LRVKVRRERERERERDREREREREKEREKERRIEREERERERERLTLCHEFDQWQRSGRSYLLLLLPNKPDNAFPTQDKFAWAPFDAEKNARQ
jgi:hypothetical protein